MKTLKNIVDSVRDLFQDYYFSLVFLLSTGLVVRVVFLGRAGLWHDEAVAHFYALQAPGWIIANCLTWINHPPLFFLLLHGWLKLIPAFSQPLVESLNLVFALATLFVFYHWLRTRFSPLFALAGGLLLAVNPFHVYYSLELRMYALAIFALTVVLYFTDRIIKRGENTIVPWTGWLLASLVALYTHSFTALYLLVLALYLGWWSFRHNCLRRWCLTLGLGFLVYSPWLFFVLRQALRISGNFWLAPFRSFYLPNLFYLLAGYIGPRFSGFAGLAVFLLLWTVFFYPLLVSLANFTSRPVQFCWLVVLLPLFLVVFLSLHGQSVFLYRVFVPLLIPVIFLLLAGYREFRSLAVFGLLLLFGLFLLAQLGGLYLNPPHQYVKKVARRINELAAPQTKVIHTGRFTFYPALFYHKYSLNEFILEKGRNEQTVRAGKIEDWLNNHRVLLVTKPGYPWHNLLADAKVSILKKGTYRWSARGFKFILFESSK